MSSDILQSEAKMQGWCERNRCSICLFILLLITSTTLVLGFFYVVGYMYPNIAEEAEECTNPVCFQSSAEIADFIDTSVDPCDNFYRFVCGKFVKTSYEKQINNLLNAERDRIRRHLDIYITGPLSIDDPHPVKMQKEFFRSCLDEDKIDADNNQHFLDKLRGLNIKWPLLRGEIQWDAKEFDWMQVMMHARWYGLPYEWFLKVDLHDRGDNVIFKLGEPNCYGSLDADYFNMRAQILEELTSPGINTLVDLENLKQFEMKFHSICSNMSYSKTVIQKMSGLRLDTITMRQFLTSITGELASTSKAYDEIALQLDYLYELRKLLHATPQRVQANYVLWKIIEYFAPYLSKPIREKYLEYSHPDVSRFKFCLQDTETKFVAVSEFADLSSYEESVPDGEKLIESVRNELLSSIEEVEWRSNKTRKIYTDVFKNMDILIGAPGKNIEGDFLVKNLPTGRLNFRFDNIIQMLIDWSETIHNYRIKMVGKSYNDMSKVYTAYEANSEFEIILDKRRDDLVLPASAFDSFLYNSQRPQYLNYAGLGTIVGTELVKRMHLLEKNKHESFAAFEENKKCLIENTHKSNKHINASVFFSKIYETILAQNLAYRTYQKYVEENGEEPNLVNLDYTPNQLFWIKSSLNWCYHPLPEEEDPQNLEEIFKYTIIETVKNSQFFAEDFNCSSDALMNPKNKCSLW